MVADNTAQYLGLNRFFDLSFNKNKTKLWSEDDCYSFENEILTFITDITKQKVKLEKLLGIVQYKTT